MSIEKIKPKQQQFLMLDMRILDALLTKDFNKNEIKVILFILRFSVGCRKGGTKNYAIVPHKRDFEACGISEHSINDVLSNLKEYNIITTWKG